jgi:hypothetical protein|tara:strand:+ start:1595 stop:1912 length:318 start_codon:yes stop_codon:yes gene_type:complete
MTIKKRVVEITTLEDVNKRFYSQLLYEYKSISYISKKGLYLWTLKRCPTYWKMCKFSEGYNLTINDWNNIRDKEYWKQRLLLKGMQRDEYILKRIREYKSKNSLD